MYSLGGRRRSVSPSSSLPPAAVNSCMPAGSETRTSTGQPFGLRIGGSLSLVSNCSSKRRITGSSSPSGVREARRADAGRWSCRRRGIPRELACPSWSRCLQAAGDCASRLSGGEARARGRQRDQVDAEGLVEEAVADELAYSAGRPEGDAIPLAFDRAFDALGDDAKSRV